MNCGLIIPTLNAGEQFRKLLVGLAAQTLPTKKLIVDSESTDATIELAKNFGLEVLTIPRRTFNHGATRQLALERLLPLDVVIFLTQDVLLRDEQSLAKLVKIFGEDKSVGMSYGRQLPHVNATNEAKFLRAFNYPPENQLRSFDDRKRFGIKTAFASNSFAAYRVEALQSVGGFPSNVPLSEDMYVAAKNVRCGENASARAEDLLRGGRAGLSQPQLHGGAGVSSLRSDWQVSRAGKLD